MSIDSGELRSQQLSGLAPNGRRSGASARSKPPRPMVPVALPRRVRFQQKVEPARKWADLVGDTEELDPRSSLRALLRSAIRGDGHSGTSGLHGGHEAVTGPRV